MYYQLMFCFAVTTRGIVIICANSHRENAVSTCFSDHLQVAILRFGL